MDYGQDGQACRQTFIYRITEGLPVIREELARHKLNQADCLRAICLTSQMFVCRLWCSRRGFEQRRHVRGGERDAASLDAGCVEKGGSDCWRAKRVSGL